MQNYDDLVWYMIASVLFGDNMSWSSNEYTYYSFLLTPICQVTDTHCISSEMCTASTCITLLWLCYEFMPDLYHPLTYTRRGCFTAFGNKRMNGSLCNEFFVPTPALYHKHSSLTLKCSFTLPSNWQTRACVSSVVKTTKPGTDFPPQTNNYVSEVKSLNFVINETGYHAAMHF